MAVLAELLLRSPFIAPEADRYRWVGPAPPGPYVGVAERAVLDLLAARGPALHHSTIRHALVPQGIDPVTLAVALGSSLLIERIAPGVYARIGDSVVPGDVERAREAAPRGSRAVLPGTSRWEGGRFVVQATILDPRLWQGMLAVPSRLAGTWDLVDDTESWSVIVEGTNLRNGVKPWVLRQRVAFPATLTLSFDHSARKITPTIETLVRDELSAAAGIVASPRRRGRRHRAGGLTGDDLMEMLFGGDDNRTDSDGP